MADKLTAAMSTRPGLEEVLARLAGTRTFFKKEKRPRAESEIAAAIHYLDEYQRSLESAPVEGESVTVETATAYADQLELMKDKKYHSPEALQLASDLVRTLSRENARLKEELDERELVLAGVDSSSDHQRISALRAEVASLKAVPMDADTTAILGILEALDPVGFAPCALKGIVGAAYKHIESQARRLSAADELAAAAQALDALDTPSANERYESALTAYQSTRTAGEAAPSGEKGD